MSSRILFAFEGHAEQRISNSICRNFFPNSNIMIECIYGTDIYQLSQEIEMDPFQDTFNILKKRDPQTLGQFTRKDFAEIYLFFDYDGHATKADNLKIRRLLNIFNNETEKGKLFISYPMVEAIKHFTEEVPFQSLQVCCNENIGYKKLVGKESSKYTDYRKYNIQVWSCLITLHISKGNYIVNNSFDLPDKLIPQDTIFQSQLVKYINTTATVATLSAFPLFIHDYFGCEKTKEIIENGLTGVNILIDSSSK